MDTALFHTRPDGQSLQAAYRSDRYWVVCRTCRKRHEFVPVSTAHRTQMFADFAVRHPEERGCYVALYTPEEIERLARRTERRRKARHESVLNYAHNASVLLAFQGSDQSVDLTSFNSLASSATAGWSSHYVDNSSNLYLDLIAYIKIAAVNTAPASNKAFYLYGATSLNTTDLPCSGASSGNTVPNSSTTSAALTFPSISTPLPSLFPTVRVIPYPVQNVANTTAGITTARAFGGILALYVWWPLLNFSSMTIAASGNVFKYRGVYNTVA